jgi:hypothetical protein
VPLQDLSSRAAGLADQPERLQRPRGQGTFSLLVFVHLIALQTSLNFSLDPWTNRVSFDLNNIAKIFRCLIP